MNKEELVMRDQAEAALLGVHPGQSDFGTDYDSEFGGDEFGADEFGYDEFGDDVFGAEAAVVAQTPAGQALVAKAKRAVASAQAKTKKMASRQGLMNPNIGSTLVIEKYTMGLTASHSTPVWGATQAVNFGDTPKVKFRPQRLIVNVPAMGLMTITDLTISNISASIGNGLIDAFTFSPQSVASSLDLPAIEPSQRAGLIGTWSTLVAPGYVPGASYVLTAAFVGHSHLAGK